MLNTVPIPLPAPVINTISPLTSLRPRGMKKRKIDSIQNTNAINVETIIFNMIATIIIITLQNINFKKKALNFQRNKILLCGNMQKNL